jgi:hypothetical protein
MGTVVGWLRRERDLEYAAIEHASMSGRTVEQERTFLEDLNLIDCRDPVALRVHQIRARASRRAYRLVALWEPRWRIR